MITQFENYRLWAPNGLIRWENPSDGKTYELDPNSQPNNNGWILTFEEDANGKVTDKVVIALKKNFTGPGWPNAGDAILIVSLEGAASFIATLAHNEDDYPRKLYYSTDAGNDIKGVLPEWKYDPDGVRQPGFLIRTEDEANLPIGINSSFQVLVANPAEPNKASAGQGINLCADFSLFQDDTPLGSEFILAGFNFAQPDGLNMAVNLTGDEQGLQFPDQGLTITMPLLLSSVKLRIGTFNRDLNLEVIDSTGQTIRQQTIPGLNRYTNIYVSAPEIHSLRLTGGGNETIIPHICAVICC